VVEASSWRRRCGERGAMRKASEAERSLELGGRRKGLLVVVIGPDGSGKTSLVDALEKLYGGCGLFQVRRFRRTLGLLPRHRQVKGWLRASDQRARPDREIQATTDHLAMLPAQPPWRSLLLPVYLALDLFLGRGRLRRMLEAGDLVLFDRYFHDCYFQRGNRSAPRRILEFLERFVPRPDLLLCIDRDAASIYAAKRDLTPEELDIQLAIARSVVARCPGGRVIDGTNGRKAVVAQTIALIERLRPEFRVVSDG
jgi:thymidylate kinase